MNGDFRFILVLYLFVCLALNISSLCAQQVDPKFSKVSIEVDGEAVFDVSHISQDHQGYLWMATNLGLLKYNGIEGKIYSIERDDFSFSTNEFIHDLHVDHIGNIWIAASSGLNRYNPDCDCIYQYPTFIDEVKLSMTLSIAEDKHNNLWIGTKENGLLHYDRENDHFSRVALKVSDSLDFTTNEIYQLLADQHNNLWIEVNSQDNTDSGLLRYNIATGNLLHFQHDATDTNSLLDNRISALYEDKEGQILIGTYKSGLHIFNPKNETLTRLKSEVNNSFELYAPYNSGKVFGNDPYVGIIHQDQNGDYWIGTSGKGINHFDVSEKTVKNYDFDLVNPEILVSVGEDRQGNIWFGGTMGSGLFKKDLFERTYRLNSNFSNVEAAYESPFNPNILWIKTQETGLNKLDLSTNEITNYMPDKSNDNSIPHSWVRSIYQEDKNTLWVGLGNGGPYGFHDGFGGIAKMNIEDETFTYYKLTRDDDGLDGFSYTVYSIEEDKEGYLWLGAGPGGIFRSNKDKTEFKNFKVLENRKPSDKVYLNIARVDKNGDIWASDFEGEGSLYLYNRKENKFNLYLKGFKMYNLLIDDNGWLLIGTWENGLVHLNPIDKSYTQYTKKNGLLSNEGVDIAKDENGIYWVNTRIGPSKFDLKTKAISALGLPKIRYNSGIHKASNGQIYLGAGSGLYSFFPDQVVGNQIPPQLNISDLLISKQNFTSSEIDFNNLTLSHKQNDLSFKYVGIHNSNSKTTIYKYRLKPIYTNWLHVGTEQTARYFNLSPGSYTFEVMAANGNGIWTEKPTFIQFTIKSPWWATWWAYISYFLIFGFLINRIYRFQLSKKIAATESKRLREINEFKNNLFTNITHEFRTPLTVIKGMTDLLKSKLQGQDDDELDSSLEMIERNSDGLLHLVNEMLDLAKLESGNMDLQLVQSDVIPFLKYVCESFESYAEENHIKLTIYSEVDSLIMDFDSNKLTSVLSNLLSNAIKFTPESGKIIVHIKQITQNDKSYLFFKVKDNGIGISEKELSNIFSRFYQIDASTIRENEGTGIGLALTKDVIDLMQGTIDVKSTLGSGSEFSVIIPITNNAPKSDKVKIGKMPHLTKTKSNLKQTETVFETDSDRPIVLIIEDNLDVAHYLKTCLEDKFETLHAPDGIKGIELAFEKIPDIIISDVMMPGKDGFEVCETLKTDERTDHIPIVILTAKATFKDKLKGLSHGADVYLAKPFVKEELFIRLDKLVANRKKLINKIQKEGSDILLKKQTKNPKLQFLKKVVKLIHKDISNSEFGSEELAKKLLVSESQVYRKIKAITGKSTAIYIRSVRLQYAKELLVNSDRTVSEVAFDVGFNDPSWFSRAFKKEFGYSPTDASK